MKKNHSVYKKCIAVWDEGQIANSNLYFTFDYKLYRTNNQSDEYLKANN